MTVVQKNGYITMKASKIYMYIIKDVLDHEDFLHPVFNDIPLILSKEEISYVSFSNEGNMFVRLSEYKVNKLTEILYKHDLIENVIDVTDEALYGILEKNHPGIERCNPKLLDNFRIENLTIDNVLDKISKNGISSLDNVDYYILKNSI